MNTTKADEAIAAETSAKLKPGQCFFFVRGGGSDGVATLSGEVVPLTDILMFEVKDSSTTEMAYPWPTEMAINDLRKAEMVSAVKGNQMVIPTMNKMMKVYVDSATVERLKCGRPGCDLEGYDPDSPMVSIVAPSLIHTYLADMLKRGVKPVTAMSYLNQLQSLFARWVRPYYEDRGWKIPEFPSLGKRPRSQHYQRPSAEQLANIGAVRVLDLL